tara:strand:- start:393 stop:593 length:201 start_codon:yes stop_codon:yes gene_type:complete
MLGKRGLLRQKSANNRKNVVIGFEASSAGKHAVRQPLGHSSVAATSHYLGVEQAKALNIAKNQKMF